MYANQPTLICTPFAMQDSRTVDHMDGALFELLGSELPVRALPLLIFA